MATLAHMGPVRQYLVRWGWAPLLGIGAILVGNGVEPRRNELARLRRGDRL
jgi:hypothetical protein